MKYDFDKVTDRRNTRCVRWDGPRMKENPDMVSMWVADMDFQVLPEIREVLHQRVEHGIFGYSFPDEAYFAAVSDWMKNRHDWQIETEWIVPVPGIVPALKMMIRTLTQPGDEIVVLKPVYYPFDASIQLNGRKVREVVLNHTGSHYEVDFDELEKAFADEQVTMMILCNPHNPVSKVFTEKELQKIEELAQKHHVFVISDEIHMDFTHQDHVHIPYLKANPDSTDHALVATAPSKTFNLAGLQISNLIVADQKIREKLKAEMDASGMSTPGIMGLDACQCAYEKGAEWVDELNLYLEGNYVYMRDFLQENMPEITLADFEGTYLVWADFNAWKMSTEELEDFMLHEAGLWLDEGYIFGHGGEGFERFNIAAPRATIEKAMNRLLEARKRKLAKTE